MPIAYYGSRISPHMTKTDEGYLICHDVPINRIGIYDYLGREIGMDGADSMKSFKVLRRPEEVFSPATLASFEGKPVTDDHPPENVTSENIHAFARGHTQNVRRGTGKDEGYTIADLYITDPQLVDDVMNGKRQISCGYTYDLFPHKNGTFEQQSLRGNHVAVVDEGRAGRRVSIKDSKPKITERGRKMASENKSGLWGRMMKVFATDESTTPEDLEELNKLKKPEDSEDEAPEAAKKLVANPLAPKKKDADDDEAPATDELLEKVIGLLGELKTMLAPKESEDELEDLIHPEHEASETPEEEAEERQTGREDEDEEQEEDASPEEQEPSVTVNPEEIKEKNSERGALDSASQAAAITRAILKKNISDPKVFKMAAKDAAAEIRKAYGIRTSNAGYGAFMRSSAAAAKTRVAQDKAESQKNRQKIYQDQQKAYDALNPNKTNKEAK